MKLGSFEIGVEETRSSNQQTSMRNIDYRSLKEVNVNGASCFIKRPDTRPPVADGWAGAEMRVFPLFKSSVTD